MDQIAAAAPTEAAAGASADAEAEARPEAGSEAHPPPSLSVTARAAIDAMRRGVVAYSTVAD